MKNLFDQVKSLYDMELYSNCARLCSLAVTICNEKPEILTPVQKCNMYLYYAESLYQLEQYAKAENIFYQAFQQRKNIIKKKSGTKPTHSEKENKEIMSDVDIKFKMHLCYVKLKQYQKAVCILQSIAARSRNAKINMALGMLFKETGMERSAVTAFKEVLRETPLALEAAEQLLIMGQNGTEVNSLMLEGTSDSTTTSWVNTWLRGQAELHARDFQTAIKTLSVMDSQGLLKDNTTLLVSLGQCYHYCGDSKRALTTLQRAYNLDPNMTSGLDILANLYSKENIEELQRLIPPDLEINQYTPAHWLVLAYSMYASKKYNKAAYFAQKACMMNPRNVEALLLKATILYDVKKFQDAVSHLREALQIANFRYEVHEGLVQCYLAMNRLREALTVASNACKVLDNTPRALTLYASVLMKESVTICKAKTLLEKAVEVQDISGPVYLPAVYMLVEIYDLEMAPEMAYHLLLKYVESCPTSRLHQLLGDVLARMGKEDKAFDHYNIALNLDPNNHRAAEGMQAIGRSNGNSGAKLDSGFYINCEEGTANQSQPPLSDQEPDAESDSEHWIDMERVQRFSYT